MFYERTLYTLHRYQYLGNNVTKSILGELCHDDGFFYPLCAKRRETNEDISIMRDNCNRPLLRNGACSQCDTLYSKLYEFPNIYSILYDYIRDKAFPNDVVHSVTNIDDEFEDIKRYIVKNASSTMHSVFTLCNAVHWCYDGTSYLDASTATVVSPKREDKFAFVDTITTNLQVAMSERADKSRNSYRNEVEGNTATVASSSTTVSKIIADVSKSKSNVKKNLRTAVADMCHGMAQHFQTFRSSAETNAKRNGECSDSAKRGSMSTKFVRYVDDTGSQPIMLNKFELTSVFEQV